MYRSSDDQQAKDARHRLGILKNNRKMNSALSRAGKISPAYQGTIRQYNTVAMLNLQLACMLVVVGNQYVLQNDLHWGRFLEYVNQNKGCRFSKSQDLQEIQQYNQRVMIHKEPIRWRHHDTYWCHTVKRREDGEREEETEGRTRREKEGGFEETRGRREKGETTIESYYSHILRALREQKKRRSKRSGKRGRMKRSKGNILSCCRTNVHRNL